MDISCHSLIRLARLAAPLMKEGGAIMTMSYEGANRVAPHYGIMGMAKASLEAATRALAAGAMPSGEGLKLLSSTYCVPSGPMARRPGGPKLDSW